MDFWSQATFNTAIVVLGVVVATALVATPLAWLTERTDLPGARALRQVLTLPYVVPSYLLAVSWVTLANPAVGWLNVIARAGGTDESIFNIYGLGGVIFVESSALFAILYLALTSSFARLDPSLEEAARMAGAGPVRVLTRISLPVLKNSILLGVLAVALASFASFGVPAMIGTPARKFLLTTGIYALLHQGNLDAYAEALNVAWKMALFSLGLVLLMKFFTSQRQGFMGSKVSRPALYRLGAARRPVAVLVWCMWAWIVAIPMAALVVASFQRDPSSFEFSNFDLSAWRKVFFELPEFTSSLRNSVVTAVIAAFVIVLFATLLAVFRWRAMYRASRVERALCRVIEEGAFVFYSLPGTVLALLLLTLATWVGAVTGGELRLSNTLGLIIVAYLAKYFSLGVNTLGPNAQLIHASLIESARLAGAGPFMRFRTIWFPLLKPAMLAALLLVLMPCLSELTMTVLLYGPGTQNLGVVLFEQQEYADRSSAAVIGTLLLGAVIVLQFGISKLRREPSS